MYAEPFLMIAFYSNENDLSFVLAESIGKVAIYDATNSTRDRRLWIVDQVLKLKAASSSSQILFIESVCNDLGIVNSNIIQVKLSSPDYKDSADPEQAKIDFIRRIKHYENAYEPLSEEEWSCTGKLSLPNPRNRSATSNDQDH